MCLTSLSRLFSVISPRACVFGIDLGTKTIGIAVSSDISFKVASPLKTLSRVRSSKDGVALLRLIESYSVSGLIVGLPINMCGSYGYRAQATQDFFNNFSVLSSLPVAYWDERLSTVAATKSMLHANLSSSKRLRLVDKLAAAFILQGALDTIPLLTGVGEGYEYKYTSE